MAITEVNGASWWFCCGPVLLCAYLADNKQHIGTGGSSQQCYRRRLCTINDKQTDKQTDKLQSKASDRDRVDGESIVWVVDKPVPDLTVITHVSVSRVHGHDERSTGTVLKDVHPVHRLQTHQQRPRHMLPPGESRWVCQLDRQTDHYITLSTRRGQYNKSASDTASIGLKAVGISGGLRANPQDRLR